MNRPIRWLAALFFAGCLVLGYLAAHQEAELKQAAVERSAAEKDAQKQVNDLRSQLVAAKEAKAQADSQIARLARDASALAGNAAPGATGYRKTIRIGDILKEHPEYAALYAKQMRRSVLRMYGDGLNTLNLPPDQLAKLKDLLVERQMSGIDAQEAAEDAGVQQGSPEWQEAVKQAYQDVQQQITGLLGASGNSLLLQLQARAAIQSQVQNNYAPDFMDAGVPLSPGQASGLVQAMADSNYSGKDTSTRPPNYNQPDPSTGLTPHDNRILGEAAGVLSPAQLQILKADQIANAQQAAVIRQYTAGGVMIRP